MDASTLNLLRKRLPEEHLGRRLIRQTEHITMRFGVREIRVFQFYWENFDLMPKVLGALLRMAGLLDWARKNALRYRVLRHDMPISGLPESFQGYRILHLSDLHIDQIADGGRSLCEIVAGLEYDLCVLTGDYRFDTYGVFDETLEGMNRLMGSFRAPDGVVAILGNHDFIEMVPGLEAMGVRLLLNEALPIERGAERIWLVGLDDAHYYQVDDLERAAAGIDSADTKILLVHSPELIEQAESHGMNLYLCGHTHGGQVCLPGGIPIIGNARCPRKMLSGRWIHRGMQGYTHRGTGSSGIPVRINCPPEIVLHRLIRSP